MADDRTILDVFADYVDAQPDALSLTDAEVRLNYRELDRLTNGWATAAAARADIAGRPVGVLFGQRAAHVVGTLAAMKAGAIAAALDAGAPSARLAQMLEQVGAPLVLTDRAHRDRLPRDWASRALIIDDVTPAPDPPRATISPDDPFSLVFTSGSTGRPKAVVRSHRAQMKTLDLRLHVGTTTPDDRIGLVVPIFTAAARGLPWQTFGAAASLHVFDTTDGGAAEVARWIQRERITSLRLHPALARAVRDSLAADERLESLTRLALVGDVTYRTDLERMRAVMAPTHVISTGYGSAETGPVTTMEFHPDTPVTADIVPVGPPAVGVGVEILDPDEEGVGVIEITSPLAALGYWNEDDHTEQFLDQSDERATRTFRSGDLGRMRPDGMLEFRGRVDFRVKVRGLRVDPSEVEGAIRSFDDVEDAVVVLDEGAGGPAKLVAYVIAPSQPSTSSLRRRLLTVLPRYMVPVVFVTVAELPRLNRGKVDRRALPAPQSGRPNLDAEFVPPRTTTEEMVASAFEQVVGVAPVGVDDDFGDLGGDSLQAAVTMVSIEAALGRGLPLSAFIEAGTPRLLAARLDDAGHQDAGDRLVRLTPGTDRTPLFCVHGGGGQVLSLAPLARLMEAAGRALVGIQMLATDRARDLYSIDRLARRYAELVRNEQAEGPYAVAGHSYGGLVAYQMAQHLSAAGQVVSACILLDTGAAKPGDRSRAVRATAREAFLSEDPITRLKEALYFAHAVVGGRTRPDRVLTQRMVMAIRGGVRYRPDPPDFPVLLIRAAESATAEGWRAVAGDRLQEIEVPGDHQSMLQPPSVEETAAAVASCLDESAE